MTDDPIVVHEHPTTGDWFMTVRISKSEIACLSEQLLASKMDGLMNDVVEKLVAVIVERVQPFVLEKVELPTITNLANLRAGVLLGERVAKAVQP